MHNTCEDSLLATPLILDLAILADMCSRISYKTAGMAEWSSFHPIMSLLSYLIKPVQRLCQYPLLFRSIATAYAGADGGAARRRGS